MDCNRLVQCQGDIPVYIKHLELRILELESACSSHNPESLGSQQQISEQCRPCEVCRSPNLYQDIGDSQEISAGITRPASESCHDNQSSQHNRPPESTFAFIPYEPSVTTATPVTADPSALIKSTQKQQGRLSSFASSINNLPKSAKWEDWISISEAQRKKILSSLVSGLAFPKDCNPIARQQPAPISILIQYGTSMEPARMEPTSEKSTVKRPFACFQELIFCSLCAVALEVSPKENVFQAMQAVFHCDAKSKSLRARIRGAKWANRAIYLLSRTDWGSCSWDIIYVASNKVNFYNEFNDYSIKPDKLIEGLKPEFYPKDPPEISLPLAIPSIIQRIYKNLVPLEKICECLGYELCDYNELDLSALEELLAEKSNTEPSKKRKMVSSSAPSKKRRRNPLPSSLEGDPSETSNGSYSPVHATRSPSATDSCSDFAIEELSGYLTNSSSPMEGLLGSPANFEIDGLFEEHPTNTSTPMEIPPSNGAPDSNDETMDGSVNDTYLSTSINDSSTSQNISFSHSPPRDDMPGLASSLSNPSVVGFEAENRDGRPAASLLSGSNILPNLDAESSMVTSPTSAEMSDQSFLRSTTTLQQGRENSGLFNMQSDTAQSCIEENHTQRERTRHLDINPFRGWLSEPGKGRDGRASDNDDLSLPPIDWDQLYNLATNELSLPQQPGSDLQLHDPDMPALPADWDQLYGLATNELSLPQQPRSDLQLNDPPPPPPSFRWAEGPFTIMESFSQRWKQPQPPSSPRSPMASESFHQNASYYPSRSIRVK